MAYLTLSHSAILHNLSLISHRAGGIDKVAVVLKDNAYGHGLELMAKIYAHEGVKRAVVRTCDEALVIASLFEEVLVLGKAQPCSHPHVSLTINDIHDILTLPQHTAVHLKVDTGMHRNGVRLEELSEALAMIFKRGLLLKGVFSHCRGGDSLGSDFFWQKENFLIVKDRVTQWCQIHKSPLPLFHLYNSPSLFRSSSQEFDFVRTGIALYGYCAYDETLTSPLLRPVLSLWGKKVSTRHLNEGEKIGYNGSWIATKEQLVSTYDIGYADGFFRLNPEHRFQTPDNKYLRGKVSMDLVSVDGDDDEICLWNNAEYVANFCSTISYDILVKLPSHLERKMVE